MDRTYLYRYKTKLRKKTTASPKNDASVHDPPPGHIYINTAQGCGHVEPQTVLGAELSTYDQIAQEVLS